MPGKEKASLVEKLQGAGFTSDQEGSGNLWEFLSIQNPGITFSKGTKSVEFLKRYRQGFAQPERHIIFRDSTTERHLTWQEGPLFHTSQAIEPDDEFLKVFLNGDDEDEEEEDDAIPPAGKVIPINADEEEKMKVLSPSGSSNDELQEEESSSGFNTPGNDSETIVREFGKSDLSKTALTMLEQKASQPPIVNNKKSQDGKSKTRKYKKRKKRSPKKGSAAKGGSSKEGKQESKPEIGKEVSSDVRSNQSEEGGI